MTRDNKTVWWKIILGVVILLGFLGALSNAASGGSSPPGGGAAGAAGKLVGYVLFLILAVWLIWTGAKGR